MKTKCEPKYVRFSRFVMTLLIASYALFGVIEGIYVMLVMTLSTLVLTSSYSLSTLLYKLLSLFSFDKIFTLNPRYERSFFINRKMEIFEEILRFIVGIIVVVLFYLDFSVSSIVVAFFMGVMMLISTYFGFCVSGLVCIGYCKVFKSDLHA